MLNETKTFLLMILLKSCSFPCQATVRHQASQRHCNQLCDFLTMYLIVTLVTYTKIPKFLAIKWISLQTKEQESVTKVF